MLVSLIIFLVCGAVSGVIAGLLGIGGGTIIVPILVYTFAYLQFSPEIIHHLALGTSFATIMVTSISSARSHHKKGAVNIELLKQITPGILLGTFCGGLIASKMPIFLLKSIFICFLIVVATQMLLAMKPKPSRQLPKKTTIFAIGNGIGLVSSFVGIGGGSLCVPFATYCNEPIHRAIGTSAAIGFPVAVAGTISYIITGLNVPNLPSSAIGYVDCLAFFGIAFASYFTAPFGVKLSHALPVATLKRVFAVFLFIIASKMVYDTVTNYLI